MITYRINAQNISAIISTLSKGMYAYPTSSVIREMIANAIDTQRLVDKQDVPIDISLPYSLDKFIRIKDEGEGMSRDFVESIWVSFGSSTKRDIDNQVGKFGLGSKSFLAISNAMKLITVKDGIKYFYFIYRSNSNNINLIYVGEETTKDCNGTCIGIPIELKNKEVVRNAVLYWTQFFKVKPIIKRNDLKEDTSFSVTPIPIDFDINGVKFQADNWQYYSHFNTNRHLAPPLINQSIVLLLGEFPYQLSGFNEGDNLRYLCDFKLLINAYGKVILSNTSERLACPLVVKVDCNRVALQEPRELINIEDEGTKEYLNQLLADIRREIENKLKEVDRSYSCPIDRFIFRLKLSTVNLSPVKSAHLQIGDSGCLFIRIRNNKLVNQATEYLNKEIIICNLDRLYHSTRDRFLFLDNITWVYDDTPAMKDKKRKLIIGKYMNEHDIRILIIYSDKDLTNNSHLTLSHIEDSYKTHQVPSVNTNKLTINKGKSPGINVYQYIGQETSCEIGLYGYSRIVNIPKDVTDTIYYIEINRGSLQNLDGFSYITSSNPQVFLVELTKVLDGPLYLVKSADIKRLGKGWTPINHLLSREDWIKLKRKKELLLVMNSTPYKYPKQHLVLDWFIQDSEIRNNLKDGLSNDNPLFNRLFELGDALNRAKAYTKEEEIKMSLININLRVRDKTLLMLIEDIVKGKYPLLNFLNHGKITPGFITALNQYISLIGMESIPSVLQEDDDTLLYKLFDV